MVCKKIQVSKYNKRKSRDFAEEYPKLRFLCTTVCLTILAIFFYLYMVMKRGIDIVELTGAKETIAKENSLN